MNMISNCFRDMSGEYFTHLHVASWYSARYGTASPELLVSYQAAAGSTYASITDRDGLYGAIRHIRCCLTHGINPIVGVNLGIREKSGAIAGRVTVLAHGNTAGAGWATLARLISSAHTPPRTSVHPKEVAVHRDRLEYLLRQHDSSAVSILLGHESDVGRALAGGDVERTHKLLAWWKNVTAGNSYLEIVCHYTEPGQPGSLGHAAAMAELAEQTHTRAVLTNAVRYLRPTDALTGDVLDSATQLQPFTNFQPQPNGQAWLKSAGQMQKIARAVAEHSAVRQDFATQLMAHTLQLAQQCALNPDADLGWREAKIPENDVIGLSSDPDRVLWRTVEAGILPRYPNAKTRSLEKIRARARDELLTIKDFGFASYFLTVTDVVKLMKERGIRNQARGSGAGSLVNYLLGISNVDPLEYDLLFERFLGNKRETLPDIDIDVESARRHEVYQAIFERYGSNRVSLMAMHNTYRARGAARDAGLALGLSHEQIDTVAKNIWRFNARDFRKVLEQKPELREFVEMLSHDQRLDTLIDITERLDRLPRHVSMHPCGVILGNNQLHNVTPVQPSGMGLPMSQFDKDDIDDVGLLKLDILGVRMQSTLAFSLNEIHRLHGSTTAEVGGIPGDAPYLKPDGSLDLDAIPHDDEPTFEYIRSAHTIGMFQIESPGQRELIGKMQPTEYNDLVADISLFRPGPMKGNMVAPFLDVKLGFQQPNYLHPEFRGFLEDSYGVVIYHEHVIRILNACMGVTFAEADEIRRAMEKNPRAIEAEFRRRTALRCNPHTGQRVFSDPDIDRIWQVLLGFGSFGFCKAHGAAFALPTYQSAWLKTHFPAEFMAGLLTHDPGMYPRRLLLAEARRMKIPILPLSVNRSDDSYRVELPTPGTPISRRGIRLSLRDVHGISERELQRILAEQPFHSVLDFWERVRPSGALLTRLAAVGALDELVDSAHTRADVIAYANRIVRHSRATPDLKNQLDFSGLDDESVPRGTPELDLSERISHELDVLKLDVSEHVLSQYQPLLDQLGVVTAGQLLDLPNKSDVLVAGIRVATQTPPMRTGKRVVFLSLDDGTGCVDCTFFEEAQNAASAYLFNTKILLVQGRTRRTGARGISLEAHNAWDLRLLWQQYREAC